MIQATCPKHVVEGLAQSSFTDVMCIQCMVSKPLQVFKVVSWWANVRLMALQWQMFAFQALLQQDAVPQVQMRQRCWVQGPSSAARTCERQPQQTLDSCSEATHSHARNKVA